MRIPVRSVASLLALASLVAGCNRPSVLADAAGRVEEARCAPTSSTRGEGGSVTVERWTYDGRLVVRHEVESVDQDYVQVYDYDERDRLLSTTTTHADGTSVTTGCEYVDEDATTVATCDEDGDLRPDVVRLWTFDGPDLVEEQRDDGADGEWDATQVWTYDDGRLIRREAEHATGTWEDTWDWDGRRVVRFMMVYEAAPWDQTWVWDRRWTFDGDRETSLHETYGLLAGEPPPDDHVWRTAWDGPRRIEESMEDGPTGTVSWRRHWDWTAGREVAVSSDSGADGSVEEVETRTYNRHDYLLSSDGPYGTATYDYVCW